MKGYSSSFESSYNKACSSCVKVVLKYNKFKNTNHYSLDIKGEPNSVSILIDDNSNVIQERYYGSDGNVYLDIDYTNHGNSKTHSVVPHQHEWKIENGINKRGEWKEIKK